MTKLTVNGKTIYSFTEEELAHVLSMNSALLITVSKGYASSDEVVEAAAEITLKEMREGNLIEELCKKYSEVVESN